MAQSSQRISVLLAFDNNYAQHGAACMASLLRHSDADFEFLIVTAGDPAPFADRIRRSFRDNTRATIDIRRFSLPPDMHFPIPKGLTPEAYIRFWIADLLPGRTRALYLDPDTIATCAVDELWQTDLGGKTLAAVPIPGSTRPQTHGMPEGSPFFNTGMILFDLDAWRDRGYRDRCLEYLHRHPERALDGDQDILNLCTIGDWLVLPFEWNAISPFYKPSHDLQLPASTVQTVGRTAKIIHYNGSGKPWAYLDEHPRKADYLANLALTDWRGVRPRDRTPLNMVRKHIRPFLPAWLKRAMRTALATGGRAATR